MRSLRRTATASDLGRATENTSSGREVAGEKVEGPIPQILEALAWKEAKMSVTHTVRTADGGTKTFHDYTRGMAIKAHCSECEAWRGNPRDCTATKCALFPFRGKTLLTREGSKVASQVPESTPESVAADFEGACGQSEPRGKA